MRIFGVSIELCFEPDDIETQLDTEDRDEQVQIEYTNAWLEHGGYETFEQFEEGTHSRPKQKVWWRI